MPPYPGFYFLRQGPSLNPELTELDELIGQRGPRQSPPPHLRDSRNLQPCPDLYGDAGHLGNLNASPHASNFPRLSHLQEVRSHFISSIPYRPQSSHDGCHKHQMPSVWETVFQKPLKAHSQLSVLQTLGFLLKELSSWHNQPGMQVIYKSVLAHNYKAICLFYTNIYARLKFMIFRS